jgi:regulator of replication initiation timing
MADAVAKKAPDLAVAVAHGEISLPKAAKQIAPKPAKSKPAPAPVIDPAIVEKLGEAQEAVSVLSEENDRLNDRLALQSMDASDEERKAAAETIAELRAKVKTLESELSAVKASRDGYMRENAQLKKQVAMQRKQLDKVAA